MIIEQGENIVLTGFATAHSHAFQRALRGRTQRKSGTPGSFWSWRGLMYDLAAKLSPEDVFSISRFAFVELAMSGVTAVGEFHYVHHAQDGAPYEERTLLAEMVIRAAQEAGLRITLIRTAYLRGGHNQELAPAQLRFADADVDLVLRDVETLKQRFAETPQVKIALAAHSIRAVPLPDVQALADFARRNDMPFHMHVAEQRREIEECRAEYGKSPVLLLHEAGVLDENFVAIHATHLADEEIRILGETKARVCLCRTTERDLGDGLPRTKDLLDAGVKICLGVDSHALSDAFEEMRAVELDERSRTEARTVAAEAPQLLQMGTQNGYAAIGMADAWQDDRVTLKKHDPAIAFCKGEALVDGIVFGASPRVIERVVVAGQTVVEDGKHLRLDEAARGYEQTLRRLDLF